jgi:hypothetical protein
MIIKIFQKATPAQHGYPAAECLEDISKFSSHYSAPDDCQRLRQFVHFPQGMGRVNAGEVNTLGIGNIGS